MNRFINEHAWFALNALLVAGIVALAAALQAGHPSAPAAQPEASASSSASNVTLGVPSKTTIEAAPIVPAPIPTSSAQQPRPRIRGGELEDDD